MKKHTIGFILFTLIVGVSAIAAAFFYQMPKLDQIRKIDRTDVYTINSEPYTKSCWKNVKMPIKGEVTTRVVQAVFNVRTEQLDMDLFLERKSHSTKTTEVTFNFFVKNGNATRYLTTETINLAPEFNLDDKATQHITLSYESSGTSSDSLAPASNLDDKAAQSIASSYQWLKDLKSHENLYVIPQSASANGDQTVEPKFDELNATSVTVVDKN